MANGPEKSDFDAIIVGGGAVGMTCGWRAAQAGLAVAVVERDRVGAGASGVAAGMLAPVGEAAFGAERLLEMNLEAAAGWPAFAGELEEASGQTIGFGSSGALHVALDRDEADELRRRHDFQRKLGLRAQWLAPSECRELEPGLTPRLAGGVFAPDEAAVDPRLLLPALQVAFERAGGTLIEQAPASEGLLESDRLAGVRLADGREFRAAATVLAAGSWSAADWLPEGARPPIRPVKGQILRLRADPSALPCGRIVAGERFYTVPRSSGELVIGATVEEQGFDTAVTAGGVLELLREAYRALPDIAELELAEARAGLRPATPDTLPLIGPGAVEGLLLATGHYRNGILLAPLTAMRIVETLSREGAAVG